MGKLPYYFKKDNMLLRTTINNNISKRVRLSFKNNYSINNIDFLTFMILTR
jgi:hypothetical protein